MRKPHISIAWLIWGQQESTWILLEEPSFHLCQKEVQRRMTSALLGAVFSNACACGRLHRWPSKLFFSLGIAYRAALCMGQGCIEVSPRRGGSELLDFGRPQELAHDPIPLKLGQIRLNHPLSNVGDGSRRVPNAEAGANLPSLLYKADPSSSSNSRATQARCKLKSKSRTSQSGETCA